MASEGSPGAERARKQSEAFRDTMEKLRSRTDAGAKVFGSIATAAIAALGYAELADFHPDKGPGWAPWALFGGAFAMLVAVGWLIWRFYRSAHSVATSADPAWTAKENELDEDETEILEKAYAAVADVNGASSLEDLEQRGRRLERCAEQGAGDKEKRWSAQADRILTEVQLAQDRAATFILRRRSTRALFNFWTFALVGLFVAGWYATALSADAMESKRTDEVELVKSCGEARKAVGFADVELPSSCGGGAKGPSSEEIVKAAKGALSDAHEACLQAVRESNGDKAKCAPLDISDE